MLIGKNYDQHNYFPKLLYHLSLFFFFLFLLAVAHGLIFYVFCRGFDRVFIFLGTLSVKLFEAYV